MVRYALAGNGGPVLKETLTPGDTLKMRARTHDGDLSRACIGDRQYHYFKVEVPKGVGTMTVSLGEYLGHGDFDLWLFVGREPFVQANSAGWASVAPGVSKTLTKRKKDNMAVNATETRD